MENSMFVWRGIERIIAVVIGAFTVYLGYLLFTKLPEKTDSQGKVVLPGGISIYMSRVGPGAFFALFGAVIVVYSIITQATVTGKAPKPENEEVRTTTEASDKWIISYLGGDANIVDSKSLDLYRQGIIDDVRKLNLIDNEILKYLDEDKYSLNEKIVSDLSLMIPKLKKLLMHILWTDEWGDYSTFERWIKKGEKKPYPKEIEKGAEIYHQK